MVDRSFANQNRPYTTESYNRERVIVKYEDQCLFDEGIVGGTSLSRRGASVTGGGFATADTTILPGHLVAPGGARDSIIRIVVVAKGTGYTPGSPPVITIADPTSNGSKATAVAQVEPNGDITRIDIINPGSGYTGTLTQATTAVTAGNASAAGDTVSFPATTGAVPPIVEIVRGTGNRTLDVRGDADVGRLPLWIVMESHAFVSSAPGRNQAAGGRIGGSTIRTPFEAGDRLMYAIPRSGVWAQLRLSASSGIVAAADVADNIFVDVETGGQVAVRTSASAKTIGILRSSLPDELRTPQENDLVTVEII